MTRLIDTRKSPDAVFERVPDNFTVPDGKVGISPAGGGPVYYVPQADFDQFFVEAPPMVWRPDLFSLEGSGTTWGYTNGRRWNGWACPLFTRKTIEYLMEAFMGHGGQEFYSWEWDGDTLLFWQMEYRDEGPVRFEPVTITDDGKTFPVWSFADGWCWDEVDV